MLYVFFHSFYVPKVVPASFVRVDRSPRFFLENVISKSISGLGLILPHLFHCLDNFVLGDSNLLHSWTVPVFDFALELVFNPFLIHMLNGFFVPYLLYSVPLSLFCIRLYPLLNLRYGAILKVEQRGYFVVPTEWLNRFVPLFRVFFMRFVSYLIVKEFICFLEQSCFIFFRRPSVLIFIQSFNNFSYWFGVNRVIPYSFLQSVFKGLIHFIHGLCLDELWQELSRDHFEPFFIYSLFSCSSLGCGKGFILDLYHDPYMVWYQTIMFKEACLY